MCLKLAFLVSSRFSSGESGKSSSSELLEEDDSEELSSATRGGGPKSSRSFLGSRSGLFFGVPLGNAERYAKSLSTRLQDQGKAKE